MSVLCCVFNQRLGTMCCIKNRYYSVDIAKVFCHRLHIAPWILKDVSATLQSGRYTISYPRGRYVYIF